MKATEFVKKKGYKTAKLIVDCWCDYPETDVYLPDMMEYTFIAIAPTENCPFVSLCELKRLVESHELVNEFFNLEALGFDKAIELAKKQIEELEDNETVEFWHRWDDDLSCTVARMKQAIADVEACQ